MPIGSPPAHGQRLNLQRARARQPHLGVKLYRELKDVVFEDVVFDRNRFDIDVTITRLYNRVTKLFSSNTTSSNTTSLNSRL